MTDDLVKRLRLISAWKTPGGPMPTEDMVNPHITCDAAADRIEQLEAALRLAAGYISTKEGHTDQHPQDVYDWIARAALEGKDG